MLVAAQTTFANLAPPDRMGQVTATMIAGLVVLEGVGAVSFAWVAGRWGVGPAYVVVGTILLATGAITGWRAPAEMTAKGGRNPRCAFAGAPAAFVAKRPARCS